VAARRRYAPLLFAVKHAALVAALTSGVALMQLHGWGLGHARWLGVKVGLVALLLVPLEGFHAYLCYVFLPRARRLAGDAGLRQVERGVGMEAIVRTIAIPLYLVAIPLLFWLSWRHPF
jgi:hypothetical protein